MRLIDADAFKTRLEHEAWSRGHVELLRARDIADETPTVDAVPVIRCKDCKWYEFDRKMHCGLPHGVRSKDDYCSDAERKEE